MRRAVVAATLLFAPLSAAQASETTKLSILDMVSVLYTLRDVSSYCSGVAGVETSRNRVVATISTLEKTIKIADPAAATRFFAEASDVAAVELQKLIKEKGLEDGKNQTSAGSSTGSSDKNSALDGENGTEKNIKNKYCLDYGSITESLVQFFRFSMLTQSLYDVKTYLKKYD